MRVEINRAGVFGPKIFPFRTLTCNYHFPMYMRVEVNRAGVFGPKIFPFCTQTSKSQFLKYMCVEINWACLGLKFPFSYANLKLSFSNTHAQTSISIVHSASIELFQNDKHPLVALLYSALELQNIEFAK